jgi:hypothetical protein
MGVVWVMAGADWFERTPPTYLPMNSNPYIINIEWDGHFTFDEVPSLNSGIDYGLYQIYNAHPVYGSNVLLYIGQAQGQSFAVRIQQEKHWLDNHDFKRLNVYVGRLAGQTTPSDKIWQDEINWAERLLIFAHSPATNTQKKLGQLESDMESIHVLNWGHRRDLLPEVSGIRWTNVIGDIGREYDENHQRAK